MNAEQLIQLLVQTVLNTIVLPALRDRLGDSVPAQLLTSVTSRLTVIVTEGRAGSFTQLKALALMAADAAIRELEGNNK